MLFFLSAYFVLSTVFLLKPTNAYAQAAPFTYQGVLKNGDGQVVPNVQVSLTGTDNPNSDHVLTGGDGSFTLHVPAGTYTLELDDYITTNIPKGNIYVQNVSINGDTTQNLTVPTQDLTVTVFDSTGQPVQNADVDLSSSANTMASFSLYPGGNVTNGNGSGESTFGTTDATGTTIIPFLPSSSVPMSVNPPSGQNLPTYSQTISFSGTNSITVNLPAVYSYAGILRNGDGQPVPNVQVTLTGTSNSSSDHILTGGDGSFTLHVPAGTYNLQLNDYIPTNIPKGIMQVNNVSITGNTNQDLTVPTQDLTVTVVNSAGQPIQNANVNLSGNYAVPFSLFSGGNVTSRNQEIPFGTTDATGKAIIPLLPSSSLSMSVNPPSGQNLSSYSQTIAFTGASSMTVTLNAIVYSYTGVLKNGDGQFVPNVQVSLTGTDNSNSDQVLTSSNGTFTLHVPAGIYSLELDDYITTNIPKGNIYVQNVSISGNTTQNLTVPTQDLTVTVLDPSGKPIQNAEVDLSSLASNMGSFSLYSGGNVTNGNGSGESTFGTTDSTGKVAIPFLPSSSVTLTTTPPSADNLYTITKTITFSSAESITISYEFPPTTAAHLTTQFADGTYSDPTTVTLSATASAGYTIANTYYTVDGGTQQTYSAPFTVTGAGNHTITYWSVDNSGVPESPNTKTFSISEAYNLTGTVYNDANQNGLQDTGEQGYAGATVALNTGQTTTTDSNGNYTFSNLEEGSYVETLTVPNGYTATTANPTTIALNANTTQNFGIVQANSLVTAINTGGDTTGNYVADTDSTGGATYISSASVDTSGVTNPAPQAVYQTVRYGNFSYTIPNLTANGTYTLRLHFNELYWGTQLAGGNGGVGSRVFNVSVNGTNALTNFDIYQAAGGSNKAVVEQIPATADSNGNITVQFSTVTDNAMVNGVELYNGTLPSPTPTPTPTPVQSLDINTGGNVSGSFVADTDDNGGTPYVSTASVDTSSVTNPAPESVYQSVRYGNFTYTIPTYSPSTSYHVRLHFNELYWGTPLSGNQGGNGSRVFNVSINGTQVLNNFDIYQAAGGANKALTEDFDTTTDSLGKINIQFSTVTDNALVNGIEITKN